MQSLRSPWRLLFAALASAWCLAAQALDATPGADLPSLLAIARDRNPDYAAMRHEVQAAAERVTPAGTLPDPRLRVELMDITRMGTQNPTVLPANVGSTRYLLMQDLPWFGKLELRQRIAELEADGAQGKALGTWSELAAKIKTAQAQRVYLQGNAKLTREIQGLIGSLEKIARSRYAGGLAPQQDVIRAQIEQTSILNELVALESESRQVNARLNALLARPAAAPLADPENPGTLPAAARLDPAALEARVRSRNPQLFTEDARIKAAEQSRDLIHKNRYPDFSFGISPTQYQRSIKEWGLMVEVNIPLQQASRRAQEREAEAMLAAARARKEETANQLLAGLAENLAGIEAARRTERLATGSLLPQAELTFNAALAGYENAKVDFATLLDAQRQIRMARQNQIKAQFEGQVRLAEIEKLLGEDL